MEYLIKNKYNIPQTYFHSFASYPYDIGTVWNTRLLDEAKKFDNYEIAEETLLKIKNKEDYTIVEVK